MIVSLISHDRWTPQRKVVLDELPAVLGRSPDADVHLDDRCQIDQIEETLVVRDLESTNGTLVNGKSVIDTPVLPGDTLTVGVTRFEVQYERHTPKPCPGSEPTAAIRKILHHGPHNRLV